MQHFKSQERLLEFMVGLARHVETCAGVRKVLPLLAEALSGSLCDKWDDGLCNGNTPEKISFPRDRAGRKRRWSEALREEITHGLAKQSKSQHAYSAAVLSGLTRVWKNEWEWQEMQGFQAAALDSSDCQPVRIQTVSRLCVS